MYNDVLFNSVDLTELPYVKIDRIILDNLPEPVIQAGKIARRDGSKLYNKEYGAKVIPIEGRIVADSRKNYLTARGTLLRYLQEQEATLRLPIEGSNPIDYTATMQNVIFSDVGGGYARFTINFCIS